MKFHWTARRYREPADDTSGGGGGPVDRGDDFIPTGPDAEDLTPEQQTAADAALAAETAAAEAAMANGRAGNPAPQAAPPAAHPPKTAAPNPGADGREI